MSTMFGIPINTLLIVLLSLTGMIVIGAIWMLFRNGTLVRAGLRNALRRPAQSVIIVLGLMLSTMIIAAALTTGDTLNHSIRSQTYDFLGHVDQIVAAGDREVVVAGEGAGEAALQQPGATMPYRIVERLRAEQSDNPNIDASMGMILEPVPATSEDGTYAEPSVTLAGLEAGQIEQFGGLHDLSGNPIDVAAFRKDEVVTSERLADRLSLTEGAKLTIYINEEQIDLSVAAVAPDGFLTGVDNIGAAPGLAMTLESAQDLFGYRGEVSLVAVTNDGGVEAGMSHTDQVLPVLNAALEDTPYQAVALKKAAIEQAETASDGLSRMFLVLGMFSVAAGVLLIFLIFVLLAAERKSEMGIARSIGMRRCHLTQMYLAEGLAYALISSLIGGAIGVGIAFAMAGLISNLLGDLIRLEPSASWSSLIIAWALGLLVTFTTVAISSWRISRFNIVAAIRDTDEPAPAGHQRYGIILGIFTVLAGSGMTFGGIQQASLGLFGLGISLIPLGAAALLRCVLPARLLYSLAGALVLLLWAVLFDWHHRIVPQMSADMELFVLSGIMMVASATIVIIWNARSVTRLVEVFGVAAARWLPAVRTAVAWPLANTSRTGLTIAMFSLIIFSLIVMATTNANVEKAIADEHAGGGWDIHTTQPATRASVDIVGELERQGFSAKPIAGVTQVKTIPFFHAQVRQGDVGDWRSFTVRGVDASFAESSDATFAARANGYPDDQAIWSALHEQRNVAAIDESALPREGFEPGGPTFELEDVDSGADTFEPVTIELADPASGTVRPFEIIGILENTSTYLDGIFLGGEAFDDLYPAPVSTVHLLRVEGVDASDFAGRIQGALLTSGVQASSIQDELARELQLNRGFTRLVQGFMALGLVVGIAALGVVTMRTVIERRQQIGMLRAIGYTARMVSFSFLMESLMITILGVLSGTGLGLWLSWQLVQSDQFSTIAGNPEFTIPWLSVLLFAAIALGAALLMSGLPARGASRVPIADALRVE